MAVLLGDLIAIVVFKITININKKDEINSLTQAWIW